MKGKIVVLAGSMEQFRYWLKHNVIPITKNDDVQRMIGAKIDAIYKEGTWYENLSPHVIEEIEIRKNISQRIQK